MSDDPEQAGRPPPAAPDSTPGISRRRLLTTSATSAVVGAGVGVGAAALVWPHPSGPATWYQPNRTGAPPVAGVHLQFGKNASTEVVVSWHTTEAVRNPRVMLGTPTSGFGRAVAAETRTYRDAKSSNEVRVNHTRLTNLTPDTDYVYAALHDGAEPAQGTVRTAPLGRKALRFNSFGDQSTPAFRDRDNPYGFVSFDVDPGQPGGNTSIKATHYALSGLFGATTAVDQFTLTKPRGDKPA
jgi:phosphodiesterase/alkaline phosphatase D-like protein